MVAKYSSHPINLIQTKNNLSVYISKIFQLFQYLYLRVFKALPS